MVEELIQEMLQLYLLPHWHLLNFIPRRDISILERYQLLTFAVATVLDPIEHIRKFKCQCGVTAINNALLLKQLLSILKQICFD